MFYKTYSKCMTVLLEYINCVISSNGDSSGDKQPLYINSTIIISALIAMVNIVPLDCLTTEES